MCALEKEAGVVEALNIFWASNDSMTYATLIIVTLKQNNVKYIQIQSRTLYWIIHSGLTGMSKGVCFGNSKFKC